MNIFDIVVVHGSLASARGHSGDVHRSAHNFYGSRYWHFRGRRWRCSRRLLDCLYVLLLLLAHNCILIISPFILFAFTFPVYSKLCQHCTISLVSKNILCQSLGSLGWMWCDEMMDISMNNVNNNNKKKTRSQIIRACFSLFFCCCCRISLQIYLTKLVKFLKNNCTFPFPLSSGE